MKTKMKHYQALLIGLLMLIPIGTFIHASDKEGSSLTVSVNKLRNSNGNVIFALYNREDAFPDEHYKKYYKILKGKIVNHSSFVIFENIPAGKYAVNIVHDENKDGKIKKRFILPLEGIGFSNFQSIGFSNKPSFKKAAFNVQTDKAIQVKIIYK